MSQFRKLVEKRFTDRFAEAIPDCRKQALGKNEPAWMWSLPNGTAWVIVEIVPPKRSFSIDAFWQLPGESTKPSGLGVKPWEHDQGIPPYRFNLGGLWQSDAVSWTAPDPFSNDSMIRMLKELAEGRRFVFTRDDIEKWISDHPTLYPRAVADEERLIYPVVDHAVDLTLKFGVQYFRRISAYSTGQERRSSPHADE